MAEQISLDKRSARRLILACQDLYPPRELRGKAGIVRFLERVRSIQFDPINVVGRNPDLVLQARVKDFQPAMLEELLYQDRVLVDNWDKMASLSLTADWPFFSRHRSRMQDIFGVPSDVVMSLAPEVIEQIKKQGPQSSLDFSHQHKTDWAWGPTRVSRAALEGLFKMGKLGVHHRINNRRYFDLIENLIPEKILGADDPNRSLEDYQAWHVLRRLGGMGLAHPNAGEQWGGMIGVKSARRRKILERLVDQAEVLEIVVEELPGEVFYLRREDRDLLELVSSSRSPRRAAFLAPLDNLLWDRKSLERVFDFSYMWEVYKPQKDRVYGYYVLPVLLGDQFVGRFDPAFDKNTGVLTIENWWWEEGYQPDESSAQALQECLADFLAYLDAADLKYSKKLLKKGGLDWLGEI